ncbi:exodeoxyribonuclease VII large subunit [Dysgonomonas sp. 216]|uniref:exodeoxyribonuclease VII large subunit n=1 Tax=Dysgonomonas sp. 216 TaxID=2302934 RepID=UPI0013D2BB8C|nr:exodeoxyribonuclease VII large subunit [Dysgonomonas sp. 216]NDW19012.1 exodeoxyribonuclease VII large subunit [Dysgonomonas sp. 216]
MNEQILSLYDLNSAIKNAVKGCLPDMYWIRTETSDVRENQNGHCYLEFIQKDDSNRNIIARGRASVWANTYRILKPYFESETSQPFVSGIKVLVLVSVEFHELYGFSLNVHNIDPSYTLGDQARNRALILKQLEEEGVLTLNKELQLPYVVNRIAVISSPTAAGYEDFCNQLENNKSGFVFYTKLFPAIMQGERTEESILLALDKINQYIDLFDAVVIIRGGGASSELSSFDSYLLATSSAQFPLPIITGIGHERDDTVLDIVAHTRCKTPTAVAEFLIAKNESVENELLFLQEQISYKTTQLLQNEAIRINNLTTHFSYLLKEQTKEQLSELAKITIRLKTASSHLLKEHEHALAVKAQYLELVSPENILKKGYTLTLKGNAIVKSAVDLTKGEQITTLFSDGKVISTIG